MLNSVVSKAVSVTGQPTLAYQVPAGKTLANVSFIIANQDADPTDVKVWITKNASPAAVDKFDAATLAAENGALRRTNIILGPNDKLMFTAPNDNVSMRVYGLEQQ